MKILGIVGSPRKKGNTSILMTKFLDEARKLGADTEIRIVILDCEIWEKNY